MTDTEYRGFGGESGTDKEYGGSGGSGGFGGESGAWAWRMEASDAGRSAVREIRDAWRSAVRETPSWSNWERRSLGLGAG